MIPDWRTEARAAVSALGFLTRLPVPVSDPALDRAARWFPLAGAAIGVLLGMLWAILLAFGLTPLAAAGLVLAAQLLLTGALHEDGLADVADGLGGGADRDRALEIMRDSRIGSYGAAALILSLLIRAAALSALGPATGAAALIVSHAGGRLFMTLTPARLGYARPEGLGATVAAARDGATLRIAVISAVLIALVAGGIPGLLALGLAAPVFLYMCHRLDRRLGGYTGDTLGAVEQVTEIAILVMLAGYWAQS